ncbi:MAG TPA: di-heme oxidoredictase family protein [Polyangia bacterium]
MFPGRSRTIGLGQAGIFVGLASIASACSSGQIDAGNSGPAGSATVNPVTPGQSSPANPANPGTSGNPSNPTTMVGGGNTNPTTPGVDPDVTTPGAPPSSTCGGEVPGSFVSACSGCHTQSGAANGRYPDLFAFKGTVADFKTKVRAGSANMAPYPASLISDSDLEAAYAYFTGSKRGVSGQSLGGVVPLFKEGDAVNPPVVFKRDDGVLVTRGAGRVRGRHEGPQDTNQPFHEWVTNYFQSRTYGWIVEDFTTAGQNQIRVTWLPVGTPTGGTNFRAWKNYNNGDVFAINGILNGVTAMPGLMLGGKDMSADYTTRIAPYARLQQSQTTQNVREGRPMKAGDMFEFEFGVFLDGGAVQPAGSRTAYYTDTFRYRVGLGGVTADNPDSYGGMGILGPVDAAQSGGGTTNVWHYYMKETAFGQMALNIQHENVQNFVEGRRLFHTDFSNGRHSEGANPVFTEQAGKAGPLFQTNSCESCHINNGAGETLKGSLGPTSQMAFKLEGAGELGLQLTPQEGSAAAAGFDEKVVMLADGTAVTLKRPKFTVTTRAGTTPKYSARVARKVIGSGLLEAIDETSILARADQKDCNQDGISGRAHFIKDPRVGALRVGRFGWKAEKVSVEHQVADALSQDIGVGTSMFPEGGKTELSDADLKKLTTYMRLVSVPGQRDYGKANVMKGEQLFKTVGCASCHATDAVTGANHPFAELRGQSIKPYTDLLLHDMGPDLADNTGVAASDVENAPAAASEWRTPPLWGTGLLATINGKVALMHDGRAANVLEAILWHGGEAEATKQRVMKLPAADREALIAFVNSL